MGPNGSGKSTLAHVLSGREGYEVTDGSVPSTGKTCSSSSPRSAPAWASSSRSSIRWSCPASNTYFLKAALNAKRKARGEEELDAVSFLRLMKEKLKVLHLDDSLLKRPVN
jgi:Fe-S cluster assembly ATP-binding protein